MGLYFNGTQIGVYGNGSRDTSSGSTSSNPPANAFSVTPAVATLKRGATVGGSDSLVLTFVNGGGKVTSNVESKVYLMVSPYPNFIRLGCSGTAPLGTTVITFTANDGQTFNVSVNIVA